MSLGNLIVDIYQNIIECNEKSKTNFNKGKFNPNAK